MQKLFNKQILTNLVLPAVYIIVVLVVDLFEPIGTITPFFAVIGLLFLALNLRPVFMIPWAMIYTVIVCSIFLVPQLFMLFSGHAYYDQYVIPILRAGTYFVVGVIFCYLCLVLDQLKKSESELSAILEGLPWPIITSDHNGKIIYWNQSAEKLLPVLNEKNLVYNYFDLLAKPEISGRTIADYLNRFEYNKHTSPLSLSVDGRPYQGFTQLIHQSHRTLLLTVLSEEKIDLPLVESLC